MDEYISREAAVDAGYLSDWYISSVGDEPPVWTDAHIDELLNDFIVIPKDTPSADVQPVKHGRWITKAEDYYKAWQDSGRSWDDMPYFVTGLKFACSNCFEQFDVNAEGVEKWNGCPLCLARMDGDIE